MAIVEVKVEDEIRDEQVQGTPITEVSGARDLDQESEKSLTRDL